MEAAVTTMTTMTKAGLRIQRVVVLGANGAMGAGAGALFAAAGCEVTLVARARAKAEEAREAIKAIAKSERIADTVRCATYDDGLGALVADCDLIFEALAEDLALKRELFERIDAVRPPGCLVATVSSGLSIRGMAEGRSAGFQAHFAGVHLYNPPHVMTGAEVIPHPAMDPATLAELRDALTTRFGRQVIGCTDSPAFAGNRVGFKLLNEVAQLAARHGVQLMDTLVGPYTGRAMAPLATIDLVGWDVHRAIVDNVAANVRDEAPGAFALPPYMAALIERGHLGDKTPAAGGFYRRTTAPGGTAALVLDPGTLEYRPHDPTLRIPFVEEAQDLNRRGRYREAVACLMTAPGPEADIARRVILGYVSYALHRVGPGEVVARAEDIDRIMSSGFNWVPPTALVDLIGPAETVAALERCGLPVPALVKAAARGEAASPLFALPFVTPGRYFCG